MSSSLSRLLTSKPSTFSARCIFRAQRRVLSTLPPPERDPNHPNLFYHPLPPPNAFSFDRPAFALSFLDKPMNEPSSKTIMGWVKEGENRNINETEDESQDFIENPEFRNLLHESIKSTLNKPDGDEVWSAEASSRFEGWLHINDMRNVPPLGRIGDPDDIIASVMVQEGRIVPNSYQPMPSYRLCTTDGPTRLTDGLNESLLERLREEWQSERGGESE